MKKIALYWAPLFFIVLTIFTLSSQPKFTATSDYWIDFVYFKTLHMVEYAGLYFFTLRATYSALEMPPKKAAISAFLIAVLFAVTDEFHQTLVPTRSGTMRDVFIDTIGISITHTFVLKNFHLVKKYL